MTNYCNTQSVALEDDSELYDALKKTRRKALKPVAKKTDDQSEGELFTPDLIISDIVEQIKRAPSWRPWKQHGSEGRKKERGDLVLPYQQMKFLPLRPNLRRLTLLAISG